MSSVSTNTAQIPESVTQDSKSPAVTKEGDKVHVGVIGAGLAGLTFAWELKDQLKDHVDVTIYEATNQVGGRMRTHPVYGDLGWGLFGKAHVEIWEFAKKVAEATNTDPNSFFLRMKEDEPKTELPNEMTENAPTIPAPSTKRYFDSEFNLLDAHEVEEGIRALSKRDKNLFSQFNLTEFDKFNLSAEERATDNMSYAEWFSKQSTEGIPESAQIIYHAETSNNNGVAESEMSLLGTLLMHNALGREFTGGTEEFRIKDGSSRLTDLIADSLTKRGVEIVYNSPAHLDHKGEAVVRLENGKTIAFDKVGLAISPRQYDPAYRSDGERLQVGECVFYGLEIGEENLAALIAKYGSVDTSGPYFQTWEGGKPGTIMLYAGGPAYKAASETPPYELLEKILPGITTMVKSYGTGNWPKEPYIGGSFAISRPGGIAAMGEIEAAAAKTDVIPFGDAYSEHFPGYANGAVASAQQAASKIVAWVKNKLNLSQQSN